MSETPKTDASLIPWSDFTDYGTGDSPYVSVEFARRLETELSEARALLNECTSALDPALLPNTNPSLPYRIGKFLAKTE